MTLSELRYIFLNTTSPNLLLLSAADKPNLPPPAPSRPKRRILLLPKTSAESPDEKRITEKVAKPLRSDKSITGRLSKGIGKEIEVQRQERIDDALDPDMKQRGLRERLVMRNDVVGWLEFEQNDVQKGSYLLHTVLSVPRA